MTNYTPDFEAFPPLLCDYLVYIGTIKNRAVKTVFEYSINLKEFLSFLVVDKKLCDSDKIDIRICDEKFFKNISLSDAYKYLSYCATVKQNSPTTRSRKVVAIRQFFKYLTDNKRILSDNPMRALDTPKKEKTLPKFLTLEQSINLLNSVDGKNKERDYAILTIFLNCGLRLSELVGLNYTDISSDNSMRVKGKGSKERLIYLNDACINAIEAYMKVRPKDGVIDKKALFLSNRLQRISTRSVQNIVDTFLEKSGLANMGLSTHKLRHTAATLMYQYGNVDILVLKDVLGHENISTTEIYTHIADSQKRDAIDSNPLSKINSSKNK